MSRSKNIVSSKKRRKKILKKVKGFYGTKKRSYTVAKNALEKSLIHSYINRKKKKREYKKLWILRINSYIRLYSNMNYSKFIYFLKQKKIKLNRKILAYFFSKCKNGDFLKKILNN
ncbi:MAG: 50S ribosomal protein L20 [Candidatus Shikimatogenerans sp. JK-2022]|nr:50S ribosomal protein L20 [Candidatus Shikimatogenerans bostrichidophilus]